MVRPVSMLLPLVAALCSADAAGDGDESVAKRLVLEMRILDEKSTQVDGKTIIRDEGNNLRLNCSLNQTVVAPPLTQPTMSWYIPSPVSTASRLHKKPGPGYMLLSVTGLQMDDSGNFSCEALLSDQAVVVRSFRLHVRSQNCGEGRFQCPAGNCIGQIYVCDGFNDCTDAKDEELETCGEPVTCGGPRPGSGERFQCGDRCRPHNYCCFQGNCTTGRYMNKHEPCCKRYMELTMSQYRPYEPDKAHYDRTYLETAIYTIIGCAVAFILIVSIMIVAFCRVHLRQSARLSSYSHMRAARVAAAHPPLAEFDHFLLTGASHFPAYYGAGPGHMMVTYNINNGVQVMPLMSPPSYSEAVQATGGPSSTATAAASAARDPVPSTSSSAGAAAAEAKPPPAGPPPPYASRETLSEEPSPAVYQSENNNGDINGNSVETARPADAAAGVGGS